MRLWLSKTKANAIFGRPIMSRRAITLLCKLFHCLHIACRSVKLATTLRLHFVDLLRNSKLIVLAVVTVQF